MFSHCIDEERSDTGEKKERKDLHVFEKEIKITQMQVLW